MNNKITLTLTPGQLATIRGTLLDRRNAEDRLTPESWASLSAIESALGVVEDARQSLIGDEEYALRLAGA